MKIKKSKMIFFSLLVCLFSVNCLFSPAVQDKLHPDKKGSISSFLGLLMSGAGSTGATGATDNICNFNSSNFNSGCVFK